MDYSIIIIILFSQDWDHLNNYVNT
jgi:hypothetical protein